MSKFADLLLPDGSTITVAINNLSEMDRKKTFYCCGRENDQDAGKLCGAPVFPVGLDGSKRAHFRICDGARHIPGCPCDESNEGKIIRKFMNMSGQGTTISAQLAALKSKKEIDPFDKTDSNLRQKTPKKNVSENTDEADFPLPSIEFQASNPTHMKKYCEFFRNRPLEENYCGVPIGDTYIDCRNIKHYRHQGIPPGREAIILCKKMSTHMRVARIPNQPPNVFVLEDASAFVDHVPGLLFMIEFSPIARKVIIRSPRDSIIAVFAQWYPHPSIPNAYICEKISLPQILIAPPTFFIPKSI